MFIIVTYDVSVKRVARVMKICRKYLTHVQKSVFEGMITQAKMSCLKKELEKIIKPEEDRICIYKIDSLKYTSKEEIGLRSMADNIL